MADESADVSQVSLPPKSIRVGLALVAVGAGLAAFDLVVDAVVTVRLLTHTYEGSNMAEFYVYGGLRLVVYAAAIPVTLIQVRQVRRRSNAAWKNLLVLLCVFALGSVPNFLVTWVELLGAVLGNRPGRPVEPWLNYAALGSMLIDVVLLLLAVLSLVLLAAGHRWIRPQRTP